MQCSLRCDILCNTFFISHGGGELLVSTCIHPYCVWNYTRSAGNPAQEFLHRPNSAL